MYICLKEICASRGYQYMALAGVVIDKKSTMQVGDWYMTSN